MTDRLLIETRAKFCQQKLILQTGSGEAAYEGPILVSQWCVAGSTLVSQTLNREDLPHLGQLKSLELKSRIDVKDAPGIQA